MGTVEATVKDKEKNKKKKKSSCKMETKRLKMEEMQNTTSDTYRTGNHIRQ